MSVHVHTCRSFYVFTYKCYCIHPHSIPRYSQRLKFMYFMKTRDERLNDLTPHIEDIMFACKELINSEKLHTVLEVVLAFGNFMNRGARRNAFGFRLASLNRIIDTKSSANRDITLLHYLIKTLETKVRLADCVSVHVLLS